MSRLRKIVERVKDVVDFLRTGQVVEFDEFTIDPKTKPRYREALEYFAAKQNRSADELLEDIRKAPGSEDTYHLDDDLDEGPDCTDKIHRRYCRQFDREVKELYWIPWDEIESPGLYLKFHGGFSVMKTANILPLEGKLVELVFGREAGEQHRLEDIDRSAIYLGPLPEIPKSLDPEW